MGGRHDMGLPAWDFTQGNTDGFARMWALSVAPLQTHRDPQGMGAGCGCKPTPSPSAPWGAHGLRPHGGEERAAAHPHGSSCLLAPQLGLEQPERVW